MDSLVSFNYNGVVIPFELTGNDVMINATEMAKAFGSNKRPSFWLRSQEARDYINAVINVQNLHIEDLIITERGGSKFGKRIGTWMYRLIAIEYARWLSPEFSVWCNMKIDEIINQGYAFRDAEIQRLNEVIQFMQPQVDYYKDVLTFSENLYSTEQICKELELGISSKTLLSKLENLNYIYRRFDGKWFLSSNFDNLGYIKIVTIKDKKTGKPRNLKRWTEEGKHWIWSLKKKMGFN